eukprot:5351405-Pyramimonas_sp.AAC.1
MLVGPGASADQAATGGRGGGAAAPLDLEAAAAASGPVGRPCRVSREPLGSDRVSDRVPAASGAAESFVRFEVDMGISSGRAPRRRLSVWRRVAGLGL